jgi:ribosomal protein L11 methyltransferase
VTTDWLRERSDGLTLRFGPSLAITERSGRAQSLVQITTTTRKAADALVREFGGASEKLRSDWLARFREQDHAKPLRIGSRLIVQRVRVPKGKQPDRDIRTIVIPAEAAFGTGEHATTAMCLRLLERVTRKHSPGWEMLDAGTGSGILAIAGSCLGARHVFAIDNDPVAVAVAARNARANGVRSIEFRSADILKQKLRTRFDFITANLFSELLITALPKLARHLARDGSLILSGILRSQEKAITRALLLNRFSIRETKRRGKWIALLAVRRTARKSVPVERKKS